MGEAVSESAPNMPVGDEEGDAAGACFLCGTRSATTAPCDGDCGGAVSACCPRHLRVHRPPGIGRCLPFRFDKNVQLKCNSSKGASRYDFRIGRGRGVMEKQL